MYTVIFDLDGTLVDTRKDLMSAGNATYADLNWTVRLKEGIDDGIAIAGGRAMIKHGMKIENLPLDTMFVESTYPLLLKHYDLVIDKYSHLYSGVIEMLHLLQEKDWKIGLCTNKPELQANTLLKKMGIRHFFGSFVGADTVGVAKPNPKPLLSAIERLGGSIDRSVLIGDTKTDRDTALAAGVKSLLVNYGHGSLTQEMKDLYPDAIVDKPLEIIDSLELLFSRS